jgi:hypothetical protein
MFCMREYVLAIFCLLQLLEMPKRLREKTCCDPMIGVTDPRAQAKSWMVVSTYEAHPLWRPDRMKCLVYQRELAEVCGPHWQIYVEMRDRVRGRAVTEALGYPVVEAGTETGLNAAGKKNRVNLVVRFGPPEVAMRYCSSTWFCRTCSAGDGIHPLACRDDCVDSESKTVLVSPKKFGDTSCAVTSGVMQLEVIDMVKKGVKEVDVLDTYPTFCSHNGRFLERVFALHSPVRKFKPVVYWLWGATGSGKSRLAKAVCKDCYFKPPDSRWFDGYDGQKVVVLNDLRKSTFTFSYLLDLLDRYPFQVEVKGGYRQMRSLCMIVTCSKPHETLWAELAGKANEHIGQLSRRLTAEREFPMSMTDMKVLVSQIRHDIRMLEDQSLDSDSELGHWDGKEPVPAFVSINSEHPHASSSPLTPTQPVSHVTDENGVVRAVYRV